MFNLIGKVLLTGAVYFVSHHVTTGAVTGILQNRAKRRRAGLR